MAEVRRLDGAGQAAIIGGDWQQISIAKQADMRRLAIMGDAGAAAGWAAIAARDPNAARLAAAWDDERAAQQAEVNAVADLVVKTGRARMRADKAAVITKAKGAKVKKGKKSRRMIFKGATAGAVRKSAAAADTILAGRKDQWRAQFAAHCYDNPSPAVREQWRKAHGR